jgi:hypothetical protein
MSKTIATPQPMIMILEVEIFFANILQVICKFVCTTQLPDVICGDAENQFIVLKHSNIKNFSIFSQCTYAFQMIIFQNSYRCLSL